MVWGLLPAFVRECELRIYSASLIARVDLVCAVRYMMTVTRHCSCSMMTNVFSASPVVKVANNWM